MGKPAPTYKSFGNLWKSMGFLFGNDLLSGWMFHIYARFLWGTSQTPWWLMEETDLFAGGGSISQGFEGNVGKREKMDGKTLPLTHGHIDQRGGHLGRTTFG